MQGELAQDLFKHWVLGLNTAEFGLALEGQHQKPSGSLKHKIGEAFAEAGVVKHRGSNSSPLKPIPGPELLVSECRIFSCSGCWGCLGLGAAELPRQGFCCSPCPIQVFMDSRDGRSSGLLWCQPVIPLWCLLMSFISPVSQWRPKWNYSGLKWWFECQV